VSRRWWSHIVASIENAVSRRRGWVAPVLSFAAGGVLSLGVGSLLVRTSIPPMVAVEEVGLVQPRVELSSVTTDRAVPVITDWFSSSASMLRGNVVEPAAAIVPVSFERESIAAESPAEETVAEVTEFTTDHNVRWFNARPARPARTIWMTVTGYSPDERSCGEFADGFTATMHSVTTNAMKLVAADPTVLPYGSMVSIPGYDDESIVPVLDCGGAIKGDKLDLLFPTHEEALKWGRQRILVTIWEYADGKPAEDPRKLR
jgi:3D (Asp-Asp-Asp) domain-containing protein